MLINVPIHGGVRTIAADVEIGKGIAAEVELHKPLAAEATIGSKVVAADEYKGAYEAVPQPYAQEFGTKGRIMREDFMVDEIRLHKAPNQHGTTITIGG